MNYLAWLGILPFVLAILLSLSGYQLGSYSGEQLFVFYSVIICCFMAGTLWGQAVKDSTHRRVKTLGSNLITLIAFFSLIFCNTKTMLLIMALCYMLLVIVEFILYSRSSDQTTLGNYISMRIQVTCAVVALHIALYLSL